MKKTKWKINYNGVISKIRRKNWLWRLFHKYSCPWKTVAEYVPKKDYSTIEQSKMGKLLYFERDLNDEDLVVIINAIRPNTFKESIEEVTTSKYYFNATTKEDINLLKSSK